MTLTDSEWFTEVYTPQGSAFALKITQKCFDEQSPYQRVQVYATETFGHLMVIDGCIMLTERDNFLYHEMLAHPVIYSHPHPKRVLIIGGGDCGTLREVLKHAEVESVIQVDIDETVTRAAQLYFPILCESNHDPRAQLHFADGIAWIRDAAANSYDVIIVDSTDPVGPAEGLFAEPFFRACWNALDHNGLLVQQSESPLYHLQSVIQPLYRGLKNAGFKAIQTLHFPQCVYPSGWWTATLASKTEAIHIRESAAATLPFTTEYYSLAIHRAALVMPEFVRRALSES